MSGGDSFDLSASTVKAAQTCNASKVTGSLGWEAVVGTRVCRSGVHEWTLRISGGNDVAIGVAIDGVVKDKNVIISMGTRGKVSAGVR